MRRILIKDLIFLMSSSRQTSTPQKTIELSYKSCQISFRQKPQSSSFSNISQAQNRQLNFTTRSVIWATLSNEWMLMKKLIHILILTNLRRRQWFLNWMFCSKSSQIFWEVDTQTLLISNLPINMYVFTKIFKKQKMVETRFYDLLVLMSKNSRFSNSSADSKHHSVTDLLKGNNIIFTNQTEKINAVKELIVCLFFYYSATILYSSQKWNQSCWNYCLVRKGS